MQIYFNIPIYTNQMNATRKQNKNQYKSFNYFNCNNNVLGSTSHDLFFCSAPKIVVLQRSEFLDKLFPKENLKGINKEEVLIAKINEKTSSGKSIFEILTNTLNDKAFNNNGSSEMQRKVIECMFLKEYIMFDNDIVETLSLLKHDDLNKLKNKAFKKLKKIFNKKPKNKKPKKIKQIWEDTKIEEFPLDNNIVKTVALRINYLKNLFREVDFNGVKSLKELKQRMDEKSITYTLREVINENEKELFNEQEKEFLKMWFGLGNKDPLTTPEIRKKLKFDSRKKMDNVRDNSIKKLKYLLNKKD